MNARDAGACGAPPPSGGKSSSAAVIATSALAVGWFVWAGFLRTGGARHIDTAYWYIAARCWLSGWSPYDLAAFSRAWNVAFGHPAPAPFVYPPASALLFLPMGALGWSGARLYFDLLNVGAAAVLLGCLAWLGARGASRALLVAGVALALTSSGLLATVYTGQTSLIVASGLALAYAGSRKGRGVPVVLGVLIASVKPQLAVPVLVWAAARGPRRRAAWLGLLLVACTGTLLLVGAHPLAALRESLATNVRLPENDPSVQYGLGRALDALGLSASAGRWALALAGAAFALALPPRAAHGDGGDADLLHLSALMAASFALAPAHDYDLVLLAPLYPAIALLGVRGVALWPLAAVLWRPAIVKAVPAVSASGLRTTVTLVVVAVSALAVVHLRAREPVARAPAPSA